jgi:hypothetical protein
MKKVCILCSLVLLAARVDAAQPARAVDYAVFSGSDVELTSYSTAIGPVYSGGNMRLEFGYGIQRPSQNSGDFYARGNFVQESLSEVRGKVSANGSVTLQGSADVIGSVVYGTQFSKSMSSDVSGTVTQHAGSVAAVSLPPATTFSPGFFDAIHSDSFTLAPGSYGVVEQNGLFESVTLSSGVYRMKSLTLLNSTSLYLNFNGLEPIKIYVQGDIALDSGFSVFVNGVEVGNGSNGLQTGYAGLTLFETHGDFTVESGFLNYFYGTIFAPFGSVTMDFQDFYGSVLASGPVTGNAYVSLRESQLLASPTPIAGDFNGDGAVTSGDLANWRSGFGSAGAAVGPDDGDADGDHDVDGADFLVWQRQLGAGGASAAALSIPEPFSGWLATCAMLLVFSGRRGVMARSSM